MDSVAGGWLGTYAYPPGSALPPCRFEATFEGGGADGTFSGRILDDTEGFGEAVVRQGLQRGRHVVFVKVYRQRASHLRPVHYTGQLTEEGDRITGEWSIPEGGLVGTWEAHRLWWGDAVAEAETELEEVEASLGL